MINARLDIDRIPIVGSFITSSGEPSVEDMKAAHGRDLPSLYLRMRQEQLLHLRPWQLHRFPRRMAWLLRNIGMSSDPHTVHAIATELFSPDVRDSLERCGEERFYRSAADHSRPHCSSWATPTW